MGIGWTSHRWRSFQYFSSYKRMKSNVILYIEEYFTRREDKLTTSPTDLSCAPQPRRQKTTSYQPIFSSTPQMKSSSLTAENQTSSSDETSHNSDTDSPSVRGVLGPARSGVLFAHHETFMKSLSSHRFVLCAMISWSWSHDHEKAHLYFKDHSNSSRYWHFKEWASDQITPNCTWSSSLALDPHKHAGSE